MYVTVVPEIFALNLIFVVFALPFNAQKHNVQKYRKVKGKRITDKYLVYFE